MVTAPLGSVAPAGLCHRRVGGVAFLVDGKGGYAGAGHLCGRAGGAARIPVIFLREKEAAPVTRRRNIDGLYRFR